MCFALFLHLPSPIIIMVGILHVIDLRADKICAHSSLDPSLIELILNMHIPGVLLGKHSNRKNERFKKLNILPNAFLYSS